MNQILVGTMLYGYCEGHFGRSYNPKRIEGVGVDWIVARELEKNSFPLLAEFNDYDEMLDFVNKFCKEVEY